MSKTVYIILSGILTVKIILTIYKTFMILQDYWKYQESMNDVLMKMRHIELVNQETLKFYESSMRLMCSKEVQSRFPDRHVDCKELQTNFTQSRNLATLEINHYQQLHDEAVINFNFQSRLTALAFFSLCIKMLHWYGVLFAKKLLVATAFFTPFISSALFCAASVISESDRIRFVIHTFSPYFEEISRYPQSYLSGLYILYLIPMADHLIEFQSLGLYPLLRRGKSETGTSVNATIYLLSIVYIVLTKAYFSSLHHQSLFPTLSAKEIISRTKNKTSKRRNSRDMSWKELKEAARVRSRVLSQANLNQDPQTSDLKLFEDSIEAKRRREEDVLNGFLASRRHPVENSWFFHACLYGHKDTLKTILKDTEFDINSVTIDDETGLHIAIHANQKPVIQMILSSTKKIDLGAENAEGLTTMDLAILKGKWDVISLIIKSRHFKWKKVNIYDLLYRAIANERYVIAYKLLAESRMNFDHIMVEDHMSRASTLSTELDKENLPEGRKEHNLKCLSVYRNYILQTLQPFVTQRRFFPNKTEKESFGASNESSEIVEELREYFECPICSIDMLSGAIKIYACQNDHWICSECLSDERMTSCPICRTEYSTSPPRRCFTSESIARLLKHKIF